MSDFFKKVFTKQNLKSMALNVLIALCAVVILQFLSEKRFPKVLPTLLYVVIMTVSDSIRIYADTHKKPDGKRSGILTFAAAALFYAGFKMLNLL